MNYSLHKAAAPVLLTLSLFSLAAVAQTSAPAQAPAPAASQGSHHSAAHHAKKRADRVEQRIDQLHSQLKITSQQSQQWDAFAQTMRDNAQRIDQSIKDRSGKLSAMNADDALKSYAALAQMHAENLQKLSSSFSALYGVLSDEQKKTADVLFRNQPSKRHMKHHHHKQSDNAPAPAAK